MRTFTTFKYELPEDEILLMRSCANSAGIVSLDELVEKITPNTRPVFLEHVQVLLESISPDVSYEDPTIIVTASGEVRMHCPFPVTLPEQPTTA